jgi:hypothetical protein
VDLHNFLWLHINESLTLALAFECSRIRFAINLMFRVVVGSVSYCRIVLSSCRVFVIGIVMFIFYVGSSSSSRFCVLIGVILES